MTDSKDISTGQRIVDIARYRFDDSAGSPTMERLDDTVAVGKPAGDSHRFRSDRDSKGPQFVHHDADTWKRFRIGRRIFTE